mmetsp:Transcript_11035/g.28702  ORF Transcript_11035/g.28702 Transcript_11035/m.28702 type:complete len:317 (+) Transcript_11035:264-1214(+)
MNAHVPTRAPPAVEVLPSRTLASPKSASFHRPSSPSSTLADLRSRCATFRSCRCISPATMSRAHALISAGDMGGPLAMRAASDIRASSSTMNTLAGSAVYAPCARSTFGWLVRICTPTSRRASSIAMVSTPRALMHLTAHGAPWYEPANTRPNVPSPSSVRRSTSERPTSYIELQCAAGASRAASDDRVERSETSVASCSCAGSTRLPHSDARCWCSGSCSAAACASSRAPALTAAASVTTCAASDSIAASNASASAPPALNPRWESTPPSAPTSASRSGSAAARAASAAASSSAGSRTTCADSSLASSSRRASAS